MEPLEQAAARAFAAELAEWLERTGTRMVDFCAAAYVPRWAMDDLLAGGTCRIWQRDVARAAMRRAPHGFIGRKPRPNPATGESLPLPSEALAARVAADQARLHARRLHWLDVEQRKYSLPRRGRLPEEMPA